MHECATLMTVCGMWYVSFAADAEMYTLLDFSTSVAIDSVVDQRPTSRPAMAPAAATTAPASSGAAAMRRHKRSNSYPDGQLAVPSGTGTTPFPASGLHVQANWAPMQPMVAPAPSASSIYTDSTALMSADGGGGGTGLSTPTSTVSYNGASSSTGQQPVQLPMEPGEGQAWVGLQEGAWHTNPAFRASWDLDEQPQQQPQPAGQLQGTIRSVSGARSPFQTTQEAEILLKEKQLTHSLSSGTGSPMIATSYDGGGCQQADSHSEAAVAAVAAAAAAAPQAVGDSAAGESGVLLQQTSRPTSSSGGTLAQRRSLNITPLGQPATAAAASSNMAGGAGRGRIDGWRSTLSPVPSASYDLTGSLTTSASATAAFGRRPTAGMDGGVASVSSGPGGAYAQTPASRISGFGSQLFSLSQRHMRVSAGSPSSSAAGSDEEHSSSEEDEGQGRSSPTRAQAARLQSTSFKHLSGASVRQIARSVRRGESLRLGLHACLCRLECP